MSAGGRATVAVPGYEVLRELGRGGMGIVYEAREVRGNRRVALKVMQRPGDPSALSRFKREFRALQDVTHPNLIALFDVVFDGSQWFFTMELVEGVDLLAYVCGGTPGGREETACPPPVGAAVGAGGSPQPGSPAHPARLRAALCQLADGVKALHDRGVLHRDLKPSNVLVQDGLVKVLDFGLAAELDAGGVHESTEEHLVGTVAYMSPEQANGELVSAASDWYSVGVMLYQALTGRLPFSGNVSQVLIAKARSEPPAPREVAAGVPEDLDRLCVTLLRRRPEERPSGDEVLRSLAGVRGDPDGLPPAAPAEPPAPPPLLGRERHLAVLAEAFAAARRGGSVLVTIHGNSGAGKTALARHFLDRLRQEAGTVVLQGRCYERESMPYKALDGVVDALAHFLRQLGPRAEGMLPRDLGSLARLFPVLKRVEAVARGAHRVAEVPDPQELRRRAFAALRELLARVGDRRPLVVCIDDLQWGDVDSAWLLCDLLQPPDPPSLLLLACYRSEDSMTSPFLRTLLGAREKAGGGIDWRELPVGPLSTAEARALALRLLGGEGQSTEGWADQIARESGGSPFFVQELVQGLGPRGGVAGSGGIQLDKVLQARVGLLPDEERRLLEVVAVSGRPLGRQETCRAAGLGGEALAALVRLESARLIRGTGLAGSDEVETYHDRVRESVVAGLDPGPLRACHGRLARALEESGRAAPEVLAYHCRGAGELARAARHFATAADQAAEALAFDRAAELYSLALELRGDNKGEEGGRLQVRLADALGNAGRGAESARQYLACPAGAGELEGVELRRRAATQFLISGHIDEGLEVARAVLGAVGMRLPTTPRRALLPLLLLRTRLWLRGTRFRERVATQVRPEELKRIDISWSVAMGLSLVDPVRGAYFTAHNLLLALNAGEPYRLARALAIEAAHVAVAGPLTRRSTTRLLAEAEALAGRVGSPHGLGVVSLCRGIVAYLEGRWQDAMKLVRSAENTFRDRCEGLYWELNTAQAFRLWSLIFLGEYRELKRLCPSMIKEAHDRGDLYAAANLGTWVQPVVHMAADQAAEGEGELQDLIRKWSKQGFHVQHLNSLIRLAELALYRGEAVVAQRWVGELSAAMARPGLSRVQLQRICTVETHARVHLAVGRLGPNAQQNIGTAERDARRLEREKRPDAEGLAWLVRAGVAGLRGATDQSVDLLERAAARFESVEWRLYGAVARRRLGQLLGGERGSALVAAADAWMQGQGIRNPTRMTAMYTPGFPD